MPRPILEQTEEAKAAAKEAAARLRKGEAPVLTVEIHTDRQVHDQPYQSLKEAGSPTRSAISAAEALGEPPLSITLDRGQVHGAALPATLKGLGAATALTNTSGGAILGQLAVGDAKLLFALYDSREKPPVAEASQSGHAPANPKMVEALKGLALQVASTRTTGVAQGSGCFVAHPQDAVPAQRLTVIDPALSIALEAHIERGRLKAFCRKASVAETHRMLMP